MHYPDMFKNTMIQKRTGPDAISATALSKQVDVAQSTFSKWLRMAGIGPSYGFPNNATEYTKMAKITYPKRPNDWSAEDKLKLVVEASSLDDEHLGAFLRSKGLHQTHFDQWRLQMLNALQNSSSKKKAGRNTVDAKRIRTLEKELNRKDKALAETAALLVRGLSGLCAIFFKTFTNGPFFVTFFSLFYHLEPNYYRSPRWLFNYYLSCRAKSR